MSTERTARKFMVFSWAGAVGFFLLTMVVAYLSDVAAWYPMIGLFIFAALAMGSTIAWLLIVVLGITRPPTSNRAVEDGRAETPRAVHRER
jgi:hypothetical protein